MIKNESENWAYVLDGFLDQDEETEWIGDEPWEDEEDDVLKKWELYLIN
jgi:hypothetical protein